VKEEGEGGVKEEGRREINMCMLICRTLDVECALFGLKVLRSFELQYLIGILQGFFFSNYQAEWKDDFQKAWLPKS